MTDLLRLCMYRIFVTKIGFQKWKFVEICQSLFYLVIMSKYCMPQK